MRDEDAIKVHITNPGDISIVRTEEKEPQHFVFSTAEVAYGVAGYDNYTQILAEDPLRKDATILSVDNPVVICHSSAQANDPANQVSGVPHPVGALLPANASLTISGTGRAWVAATSASPSRVSIAINRRGNL